LTDNNPIQPQPPITGLPTLADRLRALLDEKEDMKRVTRDIDADIETAQERLIQEMRTNGGLPFTRAGYTYSLVTKLKASTLKGQKDRLCAALKKRGFGDLVYEAVNPANLSGFVEKQMKKNKNQLPKWLAALVTASEETTVSSCKTKK
jgi:hypothetical protein